MSDRPTSTTSGMAHFAPIGRIARGGIFAARLAVTGCISSVVMLGLAASSAHASLVEALDLPALVAESDRVLLARVMAADSHYDERGQIVTDFAMQVEQTLKGDEAPGAAITLRRLGGVVGDVGMRVAGEPSFELGETVLLFGARGKADSTLRPVGMAQGALRVFEKDGARWARSVGAGISAVRRDKGQLKSAPLAVAEPRPLDGLLREVRELVEAQKKR